MRMKVYRSKSVPRALRQIRRDLGESALILSTRRIRRKRLLGLFPTLEYEITAAVDADPGFTSASKGSRPAEGSAELPGSRTPAKRPTVGSDPSSEKAVLELKRELSALRRVLREGSLPRSGGPGPFRTDAEWARFESLTAAGLDRGLAVTLLQATDRADSDFGADRNTEMHHRLAEMVRVEPIRVLPDRPLRAILLGPTGVGKTTTIAKLAALLSLSEDRNVALVNLDTYRIGASRQLAIYAEIIGVPVRTVHRLEDLHGALEEFREKDCTLIDTAGHSHCNLSAWGALPEFLRQRKDVQVHLVLAANTQTRDLEEMIEAFEVFRAGRLIFTKLDETSTPGSVASQLVRTGKRLSCLTDGQKVTENLLIPSRRMVADLAIPLN